MRFRSQAIATSVGGAVRFVGFWLILAVAPSAGVAQPPEPEASGSAEGEATPPPSSDVGPRAVVVMLPQGRRQAMVAALAERTPEVSVDVVDPPASPTWVRRAAEAERLAARGSVLAALWVERPESPRAALWLVRPRDEAPIQTPLVEPWSTLLPAHFAVLADSLLRRAGIVGQAAAGGGADLSAESPSAGGDAVRGTDASTGSAHPEPPGATPSDPRWGSGALEEPVPPPPEPPSDVRARPSGVRPAPAAPGTVEDAPEGRAGLPSAATARGRADAEYAAALSWREQARQRNAELRRQRRERRKPLMERGWFARVGTAYVMSPRGEWDWLAYDRAHGAALRLSTGVYLAKRFRLQVQGMLGKMPEYGPFGTIGFGALFTIWSKAHFAVGPTVNAHIAGDEVDGDQFGWVGLDITFVFEGGFDINDRLGLNLQAGPSIVRPGGSEEEFDLGHLVALELEIAL